MIFLKVRIVLHFSLLANNLGYYYRRTYVRTYSYISRSGPGLKPYLLHTHLAGLLNLLLLLLVLSSLLKEQEIFCDKMRNGNLQAVHLDQEKRRGREREYGRCNIRGTYEQNFFFFFFFSLSLSLYFYVLLLSLLA